MADRTEFTRKEAWRVYNKLGLSCDDIDFEQFYMGMNVELEHGTRYRKSNVTENDAIMTGKIALAHLYEFKDYYTHLNKMEAEMEEEEVKAEAIKKNAETNNCCVYNEKKGCSPIVSNSCECYDSWPHNNP